LYRNPPKIQPENQQDFAVPIKKNRERERERDVANRLKRKGK
jgi:hypothetical protein